MSKFETIYAPYTFTSTENAQNAKELASKLQEKSQLEGNLKFIQSDCKAKISRVAAEITELTGKVSSGQETRPFKCRVVLDQIRKQRNYVDANSGEIIRVEGFHENDYQAEIFPEHAPDESKTLASPEDEDEPDNGLPEDGDGTDSQD
jgi:hypothetical protein